jgi:hypothetical protein
MLLVFTALVNMANEILMTSIGSWTGLNDYVFTSTGERFEGFSFTYVLGLIFAPVAWILGVPSQDVLLVGQLLGEKTMINEFVAYADLGAMRKNPNIHLSPKSVLIATYALCGFANFASIGIQIGGIGALSTVQRKTLSELGIKALLGGTIACFLTAAIAGMLVTEYNIESIAEDEVKTYVTVTDMMPSVAFLGTLGNPDSSYTVQNEACFILDEEDIALTQLAYRNHKFNSQGGYIIPQFIDFQDTMQSISVEIEGIQLNDAMTIDQLKENYAEETAYENIKDDSGIVKMWAKADKSYFELVFEKNQLKSAERYFDCE